MGRLRLRGWCLVHHPSSANRQGALICSQRQRHLQLYTVALVEKFAPFWLIDDEGWLKIQVACRKAALGFEEADCYHEESCW